MGNLPKPSFSTEEEILDGANALVSAEDTTKGNIEKNVQIGEVILDSDLAHVRYMKRDDALLYHVFRGPDMSETFWGRGEFGLVLMALAEAYWPMDKPKIEFHADTCRPEVYEDDPKAAPRFPAQYYGAYFIVVQGIDRKFMLTEEKIKGMVDSLDSELRRSVAAWSSEQS